MLLLLLRALEYNITSHTPTKNLKENALLVASN